MLKFKRHYIHKIATVTFNKVLLIECRQPLSCRETHDL